jgi:hypothetical protein
MASLMTTFAKMRWKAEKLKEIGLPDCDYPIPADLLPEVIVSGEMILPEYLLCWMQEYSSTLSEGWEELEPAMSALIEILASDDAKMESSVEGDDWALKLGPVDLTKKIVTIQRGGRVLAALNPLEDESLRLSIYAPLDADSLKRIYLMSDKVLSMGYDSNWEVAVTLGRKFYQSVMRNNEGKSYTSIWDYGLGFDSNKEKDERYYSQRDITPARTAVAAIQLGVYYELGDI